MLRNLAIFFASTLVLLAAIELALGYVAYQYRADFRGPATMFFVKRVARAIDLYVAGQSTAERRRMTANVSFEENVLEDPKSPEAKAFRSYILDEYRSELESLLAAAGDTPVIALYIPQSRGETKIQVLFHQIFQQAGVPMVDMTNDLSRFDDSEVHLAPYNGHLSRFSNIQIAKRLTERVGALSSQNTGRIDCDSAPGPFKPSVSNTWTILEIAPYQVRTDTLGFRAAQTTAYDSAKPFLLVLGDSFTFGPYMPNEDTYPAILERRLDQHWNVVNAGVSGYTIRDERNVLERLSECARFDAIVLQVLANDFVGLTALKYNEYNFLGETIPLSEAERQFYEAVAGDRG